MIFTYRLFNHSRSKGVHIKLSGFAWILIKFSVPIKHALK